MSRSKVFAGLKRFVMWTGNTYLALEFNDHFLRAGRNVNQGATDLMKQTFPPNKTSFETPNKGCIAKTWFTTSSKAQTIIPTASRTSQILKSKRLNKAITEILLDSGNLIALVNDYEKKYWSIFIQSDGQTGKMSFELLSDERRKIIYTQLVSVLNSQANAESQLIFGDQIVPSEDFLEFLSIKILRRWIDKEKNIASEDPSSTLAQSCVLEWDIELDLEEAEKQFDRRMVDKKSDQMLNSVPEKEAEKKLQNYYKITGLYKEDLEGPFVDICSEAYTVELEKFLETEPRPAGLSLKQLELNVTNNSDGVISDAAGQTLDDGISGQGKDVLPPEVLQKVDPHEAKVIDASATTFGTGPLPEKLVDQARVVTPKSEVATHAGGEE